MTDRVGQQLGNYRLVRLLGRGGFAEVYLGQHLYTQLADAADIQNFHREAQTIASLIHPHIVRILDFDVKDGIPFLVMDYAPNGSLRRQHPKGVPLPLPTIISYIKQVAAALQYAHEQKLIHRDVKPENMLLGRQNDVLLSDFGTAIIAQSSHYQGTQDLVGTIAYMAPEQIQAHPRPASDQYALGVVVYEWLCGEFPFQGSFSEIAAKHTMMPPPSLRGKVPTLLPELEQVVMAALAKDPRQRFASVQGFAAALEQASLGARMIVPASTPMSQLLQASAKTSLVIGVPHPAAADLSMTSSVQPGAIAPPSGRMTQIPVTITPPGQSRRQVSTPKAVSEAGLHHQRVSRRTVILGLGVTGLVRAVGLTAANVPEASVTEPIRADLACQWVVLSELHIDRAYLSSLWVRERPAALQIYCKTWPVRNGTRFPKTAFQLDWQHQVIECPNHVMLPCALGRIALTNGKIISTISCVVIAGITI